MLRNSGDKERGVALLSEAREGWDAIKYESGVQWIYESGVQWIYELLAEGEMEENAESEEMENAE